MAMEISPFLSGNYFKLLFKNIVFSWTEGSFHSHDQANPLVMFRYRTPDWLLMSHS